MYGKKDSFKTQRTAEQ